MVLFYLPGLHPVFSDRDGPTGPMRFIPLPAVCPDQ